MTWMDFIAKVAGPLITAFSVLFAVYVYRRKVDAEEFLALRKTLVEVRADLVHITDAIPETAFVEIGAGIAAQVREILPPDSKPEDLEKLFKSEKGKSYLLTAIHLGIERSATAARIRKITERLRRAPYLHSAHLPILSHLLNKCISIACLSVESLASPSTYQIILLEQASEDILSRLQKLENTDLLQQEIIEIIVDGSTFAMREYGNPIFIASSSFVEVLIESTLRKDDKQLRKQRELDQKSARELSLLMNDSAERLDVLIQPLREIFTEDEWDRLIDAKARISENLKLE